MSWLINDSRCAGNKYNAFTGCQFAAHYLVSFGTGVMDERGTFIYISRHALLIVTMKLCC
jgi:hypothetical protein